MRVPAHHTIKPHYWIWLKNELLLLRALVLWIKSRIVQALILIQGDFSLFSEIFRSQIVVVVFFESCNLIHGLLNLSIEVVGLALIVFVSEGYTTKCLLFLFLRLLAILC